MHRPTAGPPARVSPPVPATVSVRVLTRVLLAAAALAGATPVAAQEIQGTVRDAATDRAVGGATIAALGGDGGLIAIAIADAGGRFRLALEPGRDSLRLRAGGLGYASADTIAPAAGGADTIEIDLRLEPNPVEVEGVTARARQRSNHNLVGFLDRLENGTGQYLGPQDVARIDPSQPTQLLLFAKGAMLVLNRRGDGVLAMRGGRSCVPSIWIDGGRIPDDSLDPWVPAQWILGVEVYREPQQAPARFRRASPLAGRGPRGAGRCPIILIWTYHGFGFGQPP